MLLSEKRIGKPSKRPPLEELSAMYEHMTAVQIAEHYGVSASTVRHWIAEYRKQLREREVLADA